jgi:hypothetical protein
MTQKYNVPITVGKMLFRNKKWFFPKHKESYLHFYPCHRKFYSKDVPTCATQFIFIKLTLIYNVFITGRQPKQNKLS